MTQIGGYFSKHIKKSDILLFYPCSSFINIRLTFPFGPECLKHEKEKKRKRQDLICDISL